MAPKRRRLGVGRGTGPRPDWVRPGSAEDDARATFLGAIERLASDVLDDLHATVLPLYLPIAERIDARDLLVLLKELREAKIEQKVASNDPATSLNDYERELRDALHQWAARRYVDVEWVRGAACAAVVFAAWQKAAWGRKWTGWAPPSFVMPALFDVRAPLELLRTPRDLGSWVSVSDHRKRLLEGSWEPDVYLPDLEPWDTFEKRMRRKFNALLREYRRRVDAEARAAGLVPAKSQPPTVMAELVRHAEWLVRYQIGEETFDAIAADSRTADERDRGVPVLASQKQIVHRDIRKLAKLIELPLR